MGRNNADFGAEFMRKHVNGASSRYVNYWDFNKLGPETKNSTWFADTQQGFDHPEVQKAFSRGQCHGLALAVNKLYGNTIGEIKGLRGPKHFFAYDKEDPEYGWDINGKRPVKDMVEDFKSYGHAPISVAAVKKEIKKTAWQPVNQKASEAAAKYLFEGNHE